MNDVNTMSGMSRSLTLPSQLVSSSGTTMGAIMTSSGKGDVICPPHAYASAGVKPIDGGWYSHFSRHVMAPASGTPPSPAQMGGCGRQRPPGRGVPPTQVDPSAPASGVPASPADPSEGSQYWPAGQSLVSTQGAPGVTHDWKEQTWVLAQHLLPHARAAEQHLPPAHTPPSPHAEPVVH